MVSLDDMQRFVGAVAGVVILAALIALVLANVRTSLTVGTQTDIIDNGTETVANVAENLPIAGIVIGLGFVLVVVFAAINIINQRREGSRF